jgi:hypothetical protein
MDTTPTTAPTTSYPDPTEVKRVIKFPDPTERLGTPPLVGILWNGEPFMMGQAVGRRSYAETDPRVLEFRSHVPGQVDLFLCRTLDWTEPALRPYTESSLYQRIIIRAGEVSTDDLATISVASLLELVLGWERGKDGHGREPLTFVDDPNLSVLHGFSSLEVNAVEFTDEHLGTFGSARVLTSLSLTGADVSGFTLGKFTRLRILHLDDLRSLGTDLGFLSWMDDLFGLDIRFSEIGQPELPTIAAHGGIRVLDLAYNPQMGPDLSALSGMTRLVLLNVSGTGADDTTLGPLRGLGSLEVLDLQCTKITDEGLEALASLRRVTTLNIAGNRITDDGLNRIVDAMPQLRKLDIRATDVTPDGAIALGRLRNLRTLGLSGTVLTGRLAEHLKDETALAQVEVGPPHPDVDEEIEAIDIIGASRYVKGPA